MPPSSQAEIFRDQWGIPHIRARTASDVFHGLGYAHARDRRWQMDALLRRGTGRFAEWVGPGALKSDILARQVDVAGASIRDYAALRSDTRVMLQSYADGVNARTAEGNWPTEYGLLDVEPQTWLPWHSIAVMRQIGFLMGSVWWKLWRASALPIVGADGVSKLRFDDGGNDVLCLPPGLEAGPYRAALEQLKPGIDALLEASAPDITGGGSNNWALGPELTATGRPLLAGDPHRVLEMPAMYAQMHLACDDFDAIGLTVPGVPGFPHFAHNGTVAWCVTHAFMDIHDLYVERFKDEGASAQFRDAWEQTHKRRETITVAGQSAVDIDVVSTRHGPVIAGDPAGGVALALRSVQFNDVDTSFDALLPMLKSNSVRALYDATRGWGLIDHNLVAGDTSGTIGYRVRAKVPRRTTANGWLPVPGWTGEHEWDGMIPWDDLPETINPKGARIVTANNRVTDTGAHYLCTDAMPPHRARRIWQRLGQLGKATVEDMASLHRDVLSIPSLEFSRRLGVLKGRSEKAEALRKLIADWDGEMHAGSVAATACMAVRQAVTKGAVVRAGLDAVSSSPYAQVAPGTNPNNQLWWAVPCLLRGNDTTLLRGSNWDDLLLDALDEVANEELQPWGEAHRPRLIHQLSPSRPDLAKRLDRLSAAVGGDNDCVFATGSVVSTGARTMYSALARYVFDVGAWENCKWIVFHGASGEPDSPWYMNQNGSWSSGELVPMLYDWDRIEALSVECVLLELIRTPSPEVR